MTDAAFWDKIAPKYAKSKISNQEAYEKGLNRTRSYLKASDSVLELGCGTGSTALLMKPSVAHYVASDISAGMIDIARGKGGADAIDFRVGGATKADFGDLKPDVVLAYNLLHLVPDLETSLRAIHDLLPQNGYFISKTPAIGGRWYLRPIVKALQLIGKAPFVSFLSVDDVDNAIKTAGFRLIETALYPPQTPSRFVVAQKV